MQCPHLNGHLCKIATVIASTPIATTPEACNVCTENAIPQGFNYVTCSIAYTAIRHSNPGLAADIRNRIYELRGTISLRNRPGSALRIILEDSGIKEPVDCDCKEYAAQMDFWGTVGCLERRDEIVAHLNEQTVSWLDMAKLALKGYISTTHLVTTAINQSCKPSNMPSLSTSHSA